MNIFFKKQESDFNNFCEKNNEEIAQKKTIVGNDMDENEFNQKKFPFFAWDFLAKPPTPPSTLTSVFDEELGFFPRSVSKLFERFFQQVFSDIRQVVLDEYRFYRYLFLTTLQCLFILFFIPFLVNLLAKQFLVQPIIEYYWNNKQSAIFINSYQQKRAFAELQDFEDLLYFESLRNELPPLTDLPIDIKKEQLLLSLRRLDKNWQDLDFNQQEKDLYSQESFLHINKEKSPPQLHMALFSTSPFLFSRPLASITLSENKIEKKKETFSVRRIDLKTESSKNLRSSPSLQDAVWLTFWKKKRIQERLQEKMEELAIRYNSESIERLTNCFADLLSLLALFFLFFALKVQIHVTQSFLLEIFFGLEDSRKSLIILLVTDLLVGYHSSNLWELFFQFLLNHYGLPENQTGIFFLVATFPVLLDVLFKYLIFRHLNRASPATVATYHALIE